MTVDGQQAVDKATYGTGSIKIDVEGGIGAVNITCNSNEE